jgi:hypothetical protein
MTHCLCMCVCVCSQPSWRRVVALCVATGVPVPSFSASLSYFDTYRRERLPANLTQAQRDFFGAHTYERVDRPGKVSQHMDAASHTHPSLPCSLGSFPCPRVANPVFLGVFLISSFCIPPWTHFLCLVLRGCACLLCRLLPRSVVRVKHTTVGHMWQQCCSTKCASSVYCSQWNETAAVI